MGSHFLLKMRKHQLENTGTPSFGSLLFPGQAAEKPQGFASFQSGTELLQTPHGCPGDETMEKLLQGSVLIFSLKEDANRELSEGEDVK